jgi:DNA-binding response OmpR family regulator
MLQILLIEDSDTDAELIQRAVERNMKTAITTRAETLAKAEEMLKQQPYNIVVLDLGLPDSAGAADSYTRIAECAGNAPVIISTNLTDPMFIQSLAHRGAAAYLNKDMISSSPNHIRSVIMFAMGRHEQMKKAFSEKAAAQKDSDDKDAMLNCLMGGYSISPKN